MGNLLTTTGGRWAGGLALAGGITSLARRRGSLTGRATLAGTITGGGLVGAGGWWTGGLLVLFFVTSDGLTRLPQTAGAAARADQRTAIQVLANGGAALFATTLSGATGQGAWLGGAAGALASANADTWATELGRRYGGRPRSIVTGQPLLPGTSGGVTPIGTTAALTGAALIGGGAALGRRLDLFTSGAPATRVGMAVALAGFTGSLIDSLLGATVQAVYRCPVCGALGESAVHHDHGPATPVRGFAWVTNDTVNALSTLTAALLAAGALAASGRRR